MTLPIMVVAGTAVLAIVLSIVIRSSLRKESSKREARHQMGEEIEERGIDAVARIVETQYVGVDRITPSVALFQLTLEVRPPEGEPYLVDKNICWRSLPMLFGVDQHVQGHLRKVDNIIPIKIHPENQMAVAINEQKLEELTGSD